MMSRQLLALVRTELRKSLRRSPREGMKIPPIVWTLVAQGFLGLFITATTTGMMMAKDAPIGGGVLALQWPAWVAMTTVFAFASMVVTQETENFFPDAIERDVLEALPIPPGYAVTAKVINVILLAAIVGMAHIVPVYILGLFTAPDTAVFAFLFPLMGLLSSVFGACFFVILGALVVWTLPRRWVKTALGMTNMLFLIAFMVGPQLITRIEGTDISWIAWFPPAWFAAPFGLMESGFVDPYTWQTAVALGSVVLMAFALPSIVRHAYGEDTELAEARPAQAPGGTSLTKLESGIFQGRSNETLVRAGYDMTRWLMWRDPKLRLATVSQFMTPLLMAFFALGGDEANIYLFAPVVGTSLGTALITQSLRSEFADGSWIYKVMPITDARPLWEGVHSYIQRTLIPPLALAAGLAVGVVTQSYEAGVISAVLCYLYTLTMMNVSHFVVTAPPYSRRFRAGASNIKVLRLMLFFALGMLFMAPVFIIDKIYDTGWLTRAVALAMAGSAFVVTTLIRRHALKPMRIDPEGF